MNKKMLLLLLLLYASIAVAQTIENAGFETPDSAANTGLRHWNSNRMYEISRDAAQARSGSSALRMKSIAGKPMGFFSQLVPLKTGGQTRKFRVSAQLKREAVENYVGVTVNVYAGEQSLFFDNMYQRKMNGSADWTEVATEFFVEKSATEIQIGGLLVGAGAVWFDDFSIEEIPLSSGNMPDSLRSYLNEALDILQQNALMREAVQWPEVREMALLMSAGARDYAACYPAINYAIAKLGDHHSFLLDAASSQQWSEQAPETYQKMPLTTGEILEGNIAYLRMPSVSSGSDEANAYFAGKLHDLLERLDSAAPRGWILDLRANGGGNCWPMLAGIGPLLGEGICGYFIVPGKTDAESWFYKKGKAGIKKDVITKTTRKPYQLRQKMPSVAVLTGPRTGSSGEVVTVAFRKRPNTRSFGEPTAGLSTGNQNFALRDGAQIFLCSSVYADREKERYGSKIIPDELQAPAAGDDPALNAARKWLQDWRK